MKPLPIDPDAPDAAVIGRARELLHARQLIVFPTDTLYALGGLALDADVARRVREAKGRDADKPLPVVAAGVEQARGLCAAWPEAAARLASRFWPGPLSLALPASARVPELVTAGHGTIAVRVPALAVTRALCAAAGPLLATSANRSGRRPPVTCEEALAELGSEVALALDAGPGTRVPSTIVDLTSGAPRLLRAGAVEFADVLRVFS